VNKRGVALTVVCVVAFAAAGATARWWLPPLWKLASANEQRLGIATNVAQWFLWGVGAILALVKWLVRPPRNDTPARPMGQEAGRDVIQAGRDAQTGGFRFDGEASGPVAGRDIHIHQQAIPQAATAPTAALHQLPRPPDDFTGRQEELEELRGAVAQGGATISGLAGVAGMGGVGKTALALKLADEMKACYPDAQFYLDLKGTTQPLTPAQAMGHVIHSFHLEWKLPESEAEVAGLYHSLLEGKQAILLMDNAFDAAQVEPLIPPAGCLLLVTSRQHFTVSGLYTRNLDVLPPDDARNLLLAIAPRIGEEAGEIAALCGRLPQALRLAASAMKERVDIIPAEYVRRLRDERKRLGHLKELEASLALSYDLLEPKMQERWRALAVFPGSFDAGGAAAVSEMEAEAATDALSALVARSMVEWEEGTGRYRLHDLLRLLADSRMSDSERARAQHRHAAYYVEVVGVADDLYLKGGEGVMRGLTLLDVERPNIEAGQRWAAALPAQDDAARLCVVYPNAGFHVFALRQHPRECIAWCEAALAVARRLNDRRSHGGLLGLLGIAHFLLGETRRAIGFHERALAISREVGDRRTEGGILGNLGLAYAALGEARRAIELHGQALGICREVADRRGELADLGNLGIAHASMGEPRRAIEYYEQAVALARELRDRLAEGATLANLGSAYGLLGQTHRAIEHYGQALGIVREIGDRRGEGQTLGNLGIAYAGAGEPGRAMECYGQSLTIARETGNQRGEGTALWNMSLALMQLGQRAEAIHNAEAALAIFEQIEDPNAAKVREALEKWRRGG